jgi:hypothetical protein
MEDSDGSLTGTPNSVVISNGNMAQNDLRCKANDTFVYGTVCTNTSTWLRFSYNNMVPLDPWYLDITNEAGYTDASPKLRKRLTHQWGYMAALEANQAYLMIYQAADYPYNMSYSASLYGLKNNQYIIIRHRLFTKPDKFFLNLGTTETESLTPLNALSAHASWYWENSTKTISYMLNYKGSSVLKDYQYNLNVYKCRYFNCTPPESLTISDTPPISRPSAAIFWSQTVTWSTVLIDGAVRNRTPIAGESVLIPANTWVVVDVALPTLIRVQIDGVLEFDSSLSHTFTVREVFINGGYLFAGFPNKPFNNSLSIVLTGRKGDAVFLLPDETPMGTKAIG